MAAILATVDIEDLATPKIQGVKDALSELTAVQDAALRGLAGGAANVQTLANALGGFAANAGAVSKSLRDVQAAMAGVVPPTNAATGAVVAYLNALAEQAVAARAAADALQSYLSGIAALATTMRAGEVATKLQAAAMAELTAATRLVAGVTAEQVAQMDALNKKMQEGEPITQQDIAALGEFGQSLAYANKEALGLQSALTTLIAAHREEQAAIAQTVTGMQILTAQLQEGTTVSAQQAAAFQEIAEAAQNMAGITEEDRQAFMALSAALAENKEVTAENAAEIERLNEVMRVAAGGTVEQTSALQDLIAAQREQQALARQNAEGASALKNELKEGTVITQQHKDAASELNTQLQNQKGLTDGVRASMEVMTHSMEVGGIISGKHAVHMKKVAEGTKEAAQATVEAEQRFDQMRLKMLATATILAGITAGFYSYLMAAAKLSARLEVLNTVIRVMGKNSATSAFDMRVSEEAIKKLGITTQEARETVIQFAQAQLSQADAAKIARAAQDLAVVAGENSSQTVERLTRAIQMQQPMLLRQVGIVTGIEAIYREYAKTLGKTWTQLDSQEKKQALINKILAEAARVQGAYTEAMEDAGKKAGSLERLQEELQRTIGDRLLPVYRSWIDWTTQLIKMWDQLHSSIQTGIVLIGVLATALASAFAAFAAAKFAAWILGFGALKTAIYEVAVSLAMGGGLMGALTTLVDFLGGGWIAVIKIAAMAIAALITAFTAWKVMTEENREALIGHMAQLVGETEKIAALAEEIWDLKQKTKLSSDEQLILNARMKELEALAPGVVDALRNTAAGYRDVAAAVREANAAQNEEIAGNRQDAQKKFFEALQRVTDAEAKHTRALAAQKEMADKVAAGMVVVDRRRKEAIEWAVRNAKAEVDAAHAILKTREEEMNSIDPLIGRLRALANARDGATKAVERMGDTDDKRLKRAKEVGAELEYLQYKSGEAMRRLASGAFETLKDNLGAVRRLTAEELESLGRTINDKLDEAEKKEQERKKRYDAAFQAARERLRGEGVLGTAQLAALEQEIGKVTRGTEEYFEMLRRGSDILAYFAKQSKDVKDAHRATAQAAEDMLAIELDKALLEWGEAAKETARAFEDFTNESLRGLREELERLQEAQTFENEKQRLAVLEEVYQAEQEAIESTAALRRTAHEQAVHLEEKRVADIKRHIQQEQQARELAFMQEEFLLRQKFELLKQESDRRIENTRKEMEIRAINLRDSLNAKVADQEMDQAESDRRFANFWGVQQLLLLEMNARNDIYKKGLDVQQAAEQEAHEGRRQRAAEDDELRKKGFAATVEGSRRTLIAIKDQYDTLRNVVIGFWNDVLGTATNAFTQMLRGATTFSEGMKGIWESIKNAFFKAVDSMINKWVSGLVEGAMQQSAGQGAGGFMKQLFSDLGGAIQKGLADLGKNFKNFFNYGGTRASTAAQIAAGVADQAPGITTQAGMAGVSALGSIAAPSVLEGVTFAEGIAILPPGYTVASTAAPSAGGVSALGATAGFGAAGGVGFGIGYGMTEITGSTKVGVLAGVGGGALVGAKIGSMVMPGIGTGIGALIGGIAGLIGALAGKDEGEKVNEAREKLLEMSGGIAQLKKDAQAAGIDWKVLLNTEDMEEFNEAVRRIDLAKQFGNWSEVLRSAQLVGFDIEKYIKIDDDEKYKEKLEEFEALLKEQQKRLEAYGVAAGGLQQRATGFVQQLQKDMEWLWDGLGEDVRKKLDVAFADAVKKGFTGNKMQWFIAYMKDLADGGRNIFGVVGRSVEEFQKLMVDAQKSFDRLGLYSAGIFARVLKETGDLNAAMGAIGPTLDMMIELQKQFDFVTGEATGKLLRLREVMTDNEDVANSLSGITQIMKGLMDASALTQEMFTALAADAADQFDILTRRGVDPEQAMLMMQPTLQRIYEAQKLYGYTVDENTQKLINQAKAQGLVGDKYLSIQHKILDVLVLIGEALGAIPPEGPWEDWEPPPRYEPRPPPQDPTDPSQPRGPGVPRPGDPRYDLHLMDSYNQRYQEIVAAQIESNDRLQQSYTAVALGDSPGGIREMTTQLDAATEAMHTFNMAAGTALPSVEQQATDAAADIEKMANSSKYPTATDDWTDNKDWLEGPVRGIPGVQTIEDFQRWLEEQGYHDPGWDIPGEEPPWWERGTFPRRDGPLPPIDYEDEDPYGTGVEDGEEDDPRRKKKVRVAAINIQIDALDGADVERVWRQKIVPQLQLDLDRNTGQLTAVMEARLSRYRKDRS